ncbi:MAG TPA: hypothetical protein VMH39_16535, partial [Gemmatimonadaceae bacterium]|nr:hypothetical protein [Gemmatimonadaceae bacterium]
MSDDGSSPGAGAALQGFKWAAFLRSAWRIRGTSDVRGGRSTSRSVVSRVVSGGEPAVSLR